MAASLYNAHMPEADLEGQVTAVLAQIQPMLSRHKGGVEFVGIDAATGTVRVKLVGSCVGCPFSTLTLKAGIEAAVMDAIPEITEVIAV